MEQHAAGPDVATLFARWIAMRAFLHRGYWLVASLYLVLDAGLSPFELVFLGTAQGIIAIVMEVPAGVVADTISRKWALVLAHALIGVSMITTGLVTAFPALVATQMVWGVGWTFTSGADVAWVTDEIGRPESIAGVLTRSARWEQVGAIGGLLVVGLLAVATGRGPAMVAAGVAMIALGLYIVVRFTEHGFTATTTQRWQRSVAILRRGTAVARHDREILLVLAATVLVNGAAEAYGRLYPKRLVELGIPGGADPILWLTGLAIGGLAAGALALWLVETRIAGLAATRRIYAAASFTGTVGLLALAVAPSLLAGSVGVLLVGGVALTVTRAVGVIWVNRRTTNEVRATVHSILAQAEYGGEIVVGVMLGAFAEATSIGTAFAGAAVLLASAGGLVLRSRGRGR